MDISPGFSTIHSDVDGGAVEIYEDVIKDTMREGDSLAAALKPRGIEVEPVNTQEFLATQMEILERREDGVRGDRGAIPLIGAGADGDRGAAGHGRSTSRTLQEGGVRDHVGPVQFNVGGIQMDADDIVRDIKVSSFPWRKEKMLTGIEINSNRQERHQEIQGQIRVTIRHHWIHQQSHSKRQQSSCLHSLVR